MRKLQRREVILLVVLGVAAVIFLRGMRSDGLGFRPAAVDQAEQEVLGDPPLVRMDLLALEVEQFEPPGRDLFQYYKPPRAAPPPRPKPKPKPVARPTRDRPKPPPPPPPRAAGPPQPMFRYVGHLGPKDDLIAFFDGNDGLHSAKVGDVVDDQFTLVEFKYEAVVMGYVDEKFKGLTTELKKNQ